MICQHCNRTISRDDLASFWLRREVYSHDDLVDGAIDRPSNGVSCRIAGEEYEAEPAA